MMKRDGGKTIFFVSFFQKVKYSRCWNIMAVLTDSMKCVSGMMVTILAIHGSLIHGQ